MKDEDDLIITNNSYWSTEDLFQNKSFSEFIFEKITSHGNEISQIDGVSGQFKTFNELLNESRALAASILNLGVKPGETVAVTCENRLEYSSVLLASLFSGTVFAPINPTYSPDEIVHILNISKPKLIFCSALTYPSVSLALTRLKDVLHVISFDDSSVCKKYSTLLQTPAAEGIYSPKEEEIAVILASSGTTGLPKGVMLNYANLKYFCKFSVGANTMNLKKTDVFLGLLPLFHGYGYGMLIGSVMTGLKIILLPKFEERLFLSTIQNHKVTNLCLVPPLMVFLGKHPLVTQYDLSSVQSVVCGAAPLSTEISKQVIARLPSADIRQGYGMTEGSIVSTITPPRSNKWESVGQLAPGLHAKIVDVSTGRALGRDQHGEVCLRGSCVMAGYCNDSAATAGVIDSDGWMHTGDVGYVDQEGYFYIVDRIKELIKFKGYQVAPAELESILLGMTGVREAAVVGKPDSVAGELPVAYVVLQPSSDLTAKTIMSHVNGKVSPHKRLHDVRFVDSVPKNQSGKILRRLLRNALNSKL